MDLVSVASCLFRWSINMPNNNDKWAKISTLIWCDIGTSRLEYYGVGFSSIALQVSDMAKVGIIMPVPS